MSICAFWIISLTAKQQGQKSILFSRHYPTVKKKAKKLNSLLHCALPRDEEVAEALLNEMQVQRDNEEFIKEYDSCTVRKNVPMIAILEGTVWPIVAIIKHGLLFACLPFLEDCPIETFKTLKADCKSIGPVTISYSLMNKIADLVGLSRPDLGVVSEEVLPALRDYLLVCMPFGTPMEMDPATVQGILTSRDSMMIPKQKVPAWRPSTYKGKQHINITIKECIRCIQHERSNMPDVCEVFGTVSCKGELEGAPEISLDLLATSDAAVLNNMVYHHCVQLSDSVTPTITAEDKTTPNQYGVKSFRFCPPLENFPLCHYKLASPLDSVPIMAYYQMQAEANVARIKIQLKLWKRMKNNFEFLQVHIPFFNRRPVVKLDLTPASANLIIQKDLRTIRWNLGSKFPSKTMEMSLQGSVHFSDGDEPVTLADKFCVGLNSYIQIFFKVVDFTYSGLKVDSRSINIYPNAKLKANIGSEFSTSEFRVWNSFGDALGYEKL